MKQDLSLMKLCVVRYGKSNEKDWIMISGITRYKLIQNHGMEVS